MGEDSLHRRVDILVDGLNRYRPQDSRLKIVDVHHRYNGRDQTLWTVPLIQDLLQGGGHSQGYGPYFQITTMPLLQCFPTGYQVCPLPIPHQLQGEWLVVVLDCPPLSPIPMTTPNNNYYMYRVKANKFVFLDYIGNKRTFARTIIILFERNNYNMNPLYYLTTILWMGTWSLLQDINLKSTALSWTPFRWS
jgi:hypothetical protein